MQSRIQIYLKRGVGGEVIILESVLLTLINIIIKQLYMLWNCFYFLSSNDMYLENNRVQGRKTDWVHLYTENDQMIMLGRSPVYTCLYVLVHFNFPKKF